MQSLAWMFTAVLWALWLHAWFMPWDNSSRLCHSSKCSGTSLHMASFTRPSPTSVCKWQTLGLEALALSPKVAVVDLWTSELQIFWVISVVLRTRVRYYTRSPLSVRRCAVVVAYPCFSLLPPGAVHVSWERGIPLYGTGWGAVCLWLGRQVCCVLNYMHWCLST